MNVNILNAYNNPYASSLEEKISNNGLSIKNNENKAITKTEVSLKTDEASDVLTKKERTFFKKLFPENSEQIDKHILFNRNGKIQSAAVSKGVIFDGRI